MIGQVQLDSIEEQQPNTKWKLFFAGARPFLFWGISLNVLWHLFIFNIANVLRMCGESVGTLAPMDSITLALLTMLLGGYMGARTIEKINDVHSDKDITFSTPEPDTDAENSAENK